MHIIKKKVATARQGRGELYDFVSLVMCNSRVFTESAEAAAPFLPPLAT